DKVPKSEATIRIKVDRAETQEGGRCPRLIQSIRSTRHGSTWAVFGPDPPMRLWTTLKSALNASFRAGKIVSDAAWKKVRAFGSVDGVRLDYLSLKESGRLLNAAAAEFRPLVQAGLLTGARWSSIAELTVGDFNPDAGTVAFRTRKGR